MRAKGAPKSTRYRGFRVRRRGKSWQVDYGMRGAKRVPRSFKTKELAREDIDEHLAHEAPEKEDSRNNAVSLYHLTQHERIDVLEALEILDGVASLREAASFYLSHHHPGAETTLTVQDLFEEYRKAKSRANCREWHLRTIDYRIGKFSAAFGTKAICAIGAGDIERWLDGYKSNRGKLLSPVSRNNFLTYLNSFFNYAVKKGYASSNPVERIDRAHFDRSEIAILTPEQVRSLLNAAQAQTPELVAYLAIAVFAGVRPTELQRLTWEDVNLDLRYIHIGGAAAKGHSERYVDIEDVLAEWLKQYGGESGQVCPGDTYVFTKLFNKAREEAGLKEAWKPDVLRHTYASYHVAKYQRKDKTALMMGHSVKMLDRHYRKPLHRSHVKEFWSILPQEDTPLS